MLVMTYFYKSVLYTLIKRVFELKSLQFTRSSIFCYWQIVYVKLILLTLVFVTRIVNFGNRYYATPHRF
jgi:hypothetical protein